MLAAPTRMEPIDRNAPATLGHLLDLEERLEQRLEQKLEQKLQEHTEKQTLVLAGEIARAMNIVIEHNEAMIRAWSDEIRAVSDRLDTHVADVTVHRRPPRRRVSAPRR